MNHVLERCVFNVSNSEIVQAKVRNVLLSIFVEIADEPEKVGLLTKNGRVDVRVTVPICVSNVLEAYRIEAIKKASLSGRAKMEIFANF
jgi:hypothetical protein